MTANDEDPRVKQVAMGVAVLLALAFAVSGALYGWRYLPGLWGEWIGTIVGLMTTPFLLEASFIFIGFVLVMAINHWRQKREGDEFVYLEEVDPAEELPEQAKWAVFREEPLTVQMPTLLEQAEGALAIADFEAAAECIAAMSGTELKRPETLALRLELAKATGRTELARELENALRAEHHETR
jgi:hypothetical protein